MITSDTGTLLYYLYEGFSGSSGLKETLKQWLQGSISVDSTIFSSFQSGLPTVSLDLGGAYTLALTADELALGYASGGTDYYEFAVSSGDDSIIGNVALGGKILVFDQDNYEVGIGTGTNCGAKVSNLGVNFTTHSGSGSGDDDESSRGGYWGVSWLEKWMVIAAGLVLLVIIVTSYVLRECICCCCTCCREDKKEAGGASVAMPNPMHHGGGGGGGGVVVVTAQQVQQPSAGGTAAY